MTQDEYVAKLKAQIGERVRVELRRVQGASLDAWHDLMRGADQAWKSMHDAFERARSEFSQK